MKGLWWKILSIVLMFYALLAGSLVPLKPGIKGVSTNRLEGGITQKISVNTYKLDLEKIPNAKAYLKAGDNSYIEANSIKRNENLGVDLEFIIPGLLPNDANSISSTILLTDPHNGTIVFPDGVLIAKGQDNGIQWSEEIPVLYKKEGFLFPYRNILVETIRNTFYHVTLWFAMFIMFLAATITCIQFLIKKDIDYDHKSYALISVGIIFGMLGIVTGMFWAKDTWGTYWTTDVKLNMAAISMMIYLAYWILRASIDDVDKRARVSSAYAIFAFFAIIPLIFVVPRITDSLHPGNGGNPALGGEDMDHTMRMVFYPAIIGFTLVGVWVASLILRKKRIEEKFFLNE